MESLTQIPVLTLTSGPYLLLNEKYPDKTVEEGLKHFIRYLLKPADSRHLSSATEDEKYEMYKEWFLEQRRLEQTGKTSWEAITTWGFYT